MAHLCDGLLKLLDVESPTVLLMQIVRDKSTTGQLDAGRVQRVLGDGHQPAVLLVADKHGKQVVYRRRGAVCHVDVLGVAREAVALLDARCDHPPAHRGALAVA
eukprot:scaffold265886_cov38-Prasinocladus_malaysianus.AAC.1